MKLISMTDYVLEKSKECQFKDDCEFAYLVRGYANFLKQPLKLGMFIPCDENDVPLDEPSDYKFWKQDSEFGAYNGCQENKCMEYEQAKERVIFEGFNDISFIEKLISINEKVEILDDLGLKLTDSAIKKYNL